MTTDGGESSPISATRSGLVRAKGGAGKGRKQQSSLRSHFGFTAPAPPSPASPMSRVLNRFYQLIGKTGYWQ